MMAWEAGRRADEQSRRWANGVAVGLMVFLLTGCVLPLPGNDFHDDPEPNILHVAVPCELVDRVDTSGVMTNPADSVVLVCKSSEYPTVRGRSTVFQYVDFVDPAESKGLRAMVRRTLSEDEQVVTYGTFCGGTIEAGGWADTPALDTDPSQLKVRC